MMEWSKKEWLSLKDEMSIDVYVGLSYDALRLGTIL